MATTATLQCVRADHNTNPSYLSISYKSNVPRYSMDPYWSSLYYTSVGDICIIHLFVTSQTRFGSALDAAPNSGAGFPQCSAIFNGFSDAPPTPTSVPHVFGHTNIVTLTEIPADFTFSSDAHLLYCWPVLLGDLVELRPLEAQNLLWLYAGPVFLGGKP